MDYRLHSNRAACYLKLNDNEHCIQNASRVSVRYTVAICMKDVEDYIECKAGSILLIIYIYCFRNPLLPFENLILQAYKMKLIYKYYVCPSKCLTDPDDFNHAAKIACTKFTRIYVLSH